MFGSVVWQVVGQQSGQQVASWKVLGLSWKRLGRSWVRLGRSWVSLGRSWDGLGGVLDAFWELWGPS